ncbi:MAG TPA: FtsQ-type POTRA domain-containing protein [Thermoanaerobaculia bacterium]|nr:FtsQ-type POTRA domain-containing protein [Thermoanaerobaculia bacterium]
MSGLDTTHPRFLRPIDVARIRRNQNRIQVQRVLHMARNTALTALAVLLAVWLYQGTRSDARFAVRNVEVLGTVRSSAEDVALLEAQYEGRNLFKIDIARLQEDVRRLPWVSRITVEKKLPDTLRIRVVEREPVALVQNGGTLRYVDGQGTPFADLSPSAGNPDLPLIREAGGAELLRSVELIGRLRESDPALYSRISDLMPIAPDGFAIHDRELGGLVLANAADISEKWRSLYGIARADRLAHGSIQYADLRFTDRIVIKPVIPSVARNPGGGEAR